MTRDRLAAAWHPPLRGVRAVAQIWKQLSLNEHRKLVPQLVREVVFGLKQSTIAVTLNSEAVVEFVEALSLSNHLG